MLRLDAGEIRIGASDMTLEFCLLPYLEMFHKKYSNVKISITNNPTPQTLELLKQNKIDFAAVSEPFDTSGIEVFQAREIKDIFICSTNNKIPDGISVAELKDELIMLESNTSTRTFLDIEFRKRGFSASPKFELATSPQIVGFAERNMGIGCVVYDFAEQAIRSGKVREIKVSDPLINRHICIVRNSDIISVAADKLLDMIINSPV
ncbi:MAG: LysR family transcriptional regulator substrate-binding protein [Oscillospiraceae bacterium]|nr:LysR family transcriptional regulator substrate-binding protein [Oscillospiraceae bacterium]